MQLFTKWVPKPGPGDRRRRARRGRAVADAAAACRPSTCCSSTPGTTPTRRGSTRSSTCRTCKREGLIRHLGLTNVDAAHLRVVLASGIEVVSNQVSCSLIDRRAAGRLAAVCARVRRGAAGLRHRVRRLAQRAVAGRRRARLGARRHLVADEVRPLHPRGRRLAGAAARAARRPATWPTRHGVSLTNVATRFVMEQPGVAAVIVGARLGERAHIDDNARLCAFALDAPTTARSSRRRIATLDADPRRLRRRVPQAAVPHRVGRPEPPPRRVPAAVRGAARAARHTPLLQRHRVGAVGRLSRARRGRGSASACRAPPPRTATGVLGGADPAAQTHAVIDKIDGALQSLGGRLDDVVRTRVFVSHLEHWEPVARAHGERFAHIQPANTLVEARLVGADTWWRSRPTPRCLGEGLGPGLGPRRTLARLCATHTPLVAVTPGAAPVPAPSPQPLAVRIARCTSAARPSSGSSVWRRPTASRSGSSGKAPIPPAA